jgi:hypothetical protein
MESNDAIYIIPKKDNVVYVPGRRTGKQVAQFQFYLRLALNENDFDKVNEVLLRFGITNDKVRKALCVGLLDMWKKGNIPPATQEDVWPELSQEDAESIAALDENLSSKEVALLSAMVRCARARPHPTNRIRYEDERLMKEAGFPNLKTYRAVFTSLGKRGLVKVAVVGSKDPMTTFELPWLPPMETWLATHFAEKPEGKVDWNLIEIPKEGE